MQGLCRRCLNPHYFCACPAPIKVEEAHTTMPYNLSEEDQKIYESAMNDVLNVPEGTKPTQEALDRLLEVENSRFYVGMSGYSAGKLSGTLHPL